MEKQGFEIKKCSFSSGPLKTVGLRFIPKERSALAIFTHGYTASKSDLLFWAQRLLRRNVETLIFDLPGHYLGAGEEVHYFHDFTEHAPKLFSEALKLLNPLGEEKLILGGHSLGGLLALKALELSDLATYQKITIAVGVGLTKEEELHPLQKSFFKETLDFRQKLVSPSLAPEKIFPWLNAMKKNTHFTNEKIYLVTGEDDLIVPHQGTERLFEILKEKGNDVELKRPRRLPHHEPALASPYIEEIVATLDF